MQKFRVFSRDFSAFCRIFNWSSAYNGTVETTTDQRNLSIIGSDDTQISSQKWVQIDIKVSLFYLIHPANSNSRRNWVFLRGFSVFYVVVEFLSPLLHIVSQAKQSKQLLTKENRIL